MYAMKMNTWIITMSPGREQCSLLPPLCTCIAFCDFPQANEFNEVLPVWAEANWWVTMVYLSTAKSANCSQLQRSLPLTLLTLPSVEAWNGTASTLRAEPLWAPNPLPVWWIIHWPHETSLLNDYQEIVIAMMISGIGQPSKQRQGKHTRHMLRWLSSTWSPYTASSRVGMSTTAFVPTGPCPNFGRPKDIEI